MPCLRMCGLLLVGLPLLSAGCGGESTAALQGNVTLDGEAVALGSISFFPTAGEGRKAAAAIEQGHYSIPAEEGLAAGKYRVEVSWRKPTGRKIPSADPGQTSDETQEAIPAKYNTASTLTTDIGDGQVVRDFALTTK